MTMLALIAAALAAAQTTSPAAAPAPAAPAAAPASAQAAAPPARPSDVASPEALVRALYDVISGPAGQARDWDRMRSLFHPTASLTATVRNPAGALLVRTTTPAEYIARSGPYLLQNGFFEREIARKVERYAQVAHVFSTYEARATADLATPPMMRGINSIQLLNDGTRWWVLSLAWSQESSADPIPAGYLPR